MAFRDFEIAETRQFMIGGSIGGLCYLSPVSSGGFRRSLWSCLLIRRFRLPYVDRRCVECVLDMGSVKLLNHLNTRPAVLRDLIDVRAFHEPHTYICVPQAVGGTPIALAV